MSAIVGLILLILSAPSMGAQETGQYGEIVFAVGQEFSIISTGSTRSYNPSAPSALGLRVQEGDLIQTSADTFLEIQLIPSGSVLKLAENTSFILRAMGGSGEENAFKLVYGRVRAKVNKLSGTESFSIRSGQTIAGVRGTDFGFDATVTPQGTTEGQQQWRPDVTVYCFSGEVAVYPSAPEVTEEESTATTASPEGETEGAQVGQEPPEQKVAPKPIPYIVIKANEQATVALQSGIPLVERAQVEEQTMSYWKDNDFKGETPLPAPKGVNLSQEETVTPPAPKVATATTQPSAKAAAPIATSPTAGTESMDQQGPSPQTTEATPAASPAEKVVEIRYIPPDLGPFKKAMALKNSALMGAGAFALLGITIQAIGLMGITNNNSDLGMQYLGVGSLCIGMSATILTTGFLIKLPD